MEFPVGAVRGEERRIIRVEGRDFPGPGIQGEAGRPVVQALIMCRGLNTPTPGVLPHSLRWPLT